MQAKVIYKDLGLIPYKKAFDIQQSLFDDIVETKLKNRKLPSGNALKNNNYFILCEHPHVITLGKSGKEDNLLIDTKTLTSKGIEYHKTTRGGDITYHGPGQIVGYPILDLELFFNSIHKYIYALEEIIIRTLNDYNIKAGRLKEFTGVWLNCDDSSLSRKICAIGVKASRWVTMHGFALNVNSDLDYFKNIVPCGIEGKNVTSMEAETGKKINIDKVKSRIRDHFSEIFEAKLEADNHGSN